jgi:hypothetical protein
MNVVVAGRVSSWGAGTGCEGLDAWVGDCAAAVPANNAHTTTVAVSRKEVVTNKAQRLS